MADSGMDGFGIGAQTEANAAAAIGMQGALNPDVFQNRLGIEIHRTENAGEAEEILIFQPGSTAALVNFHAQPVAFFPDIGR